MSSYKSSLSQVFNEYQRKQDFSRNMQVLNKIFHNYTINSKQKNLKEQVTKIRNFSIDDLNSQDGGAGELIASSLKSNDAPI